MLTCLYLAIVVYAPALALAQVTGMDMNLSIGLTFLVCIFYTALGGIKAVIWTNVFQALCMITIRAYQRVMTTMRLADYISAYLLHMKCTLRPNMTLM